MTCLLRTSLVVLTLISQVLGSAAVLCMEGNGSVLLELQLGECCGSTDGQGQTSSAADDEGDCGGCSDLSLADFDRDRELDGLVLALDEVATPTLAEFPWGPTLRPCPSKQPADDPDRDGRAPFVVACVAATIVLTC